MASTEVERRIEGEFNWQIPMVVASFVDGSAGKSVYEVHVQDADERFGGNKYLRVVGFDSERGVAVGSNLFTSGHINELVNPLGLRTVVPSDDVNGDISRMIEEKHYTDFNAVVVRSRIDSYEMNNGILRNLVETVEEREGKVRFPFMVSGFYVAPFEDSEGYQMKIFPAEDFRVVEDERLDGKKHGTGANFSEVDELGLPRFDRKGSKTWYASEGGISGLVLDRDLCLFSDDGNLGGSATVGRVVLVSGEASAPDIRKQLEKRYETQKSEL